MRSRCSAEPTRRHVSTGPPGGLRRPRPAAADDPASLSLGHPGHNPALASPPRAPEVDLPYDVVAELVQRMAGRTRAGATAGSRANCSNSATASAPRRSAGSCTAAGSPGRRGLDRLGQHRTFDTDALAAAFPFASPELPADQHTGRSHQGHRLRWRRRFRPRPLQRWRGVRCCGGTGGWGALRLQPRLAVVGVLGPVRLRQLQLRHPGPVRRGQVLPGQTRTAALAVPRRRGPRHRPRRRIHPPRPRRRRRRRHPRRTRRAPQPVRPADHRPRRATHRAARRVDPPRAVPAHLPHRPARRAAHRRSTGPCSTPPSPTTYTAAGITDDPATWARPAPLLADLRATLTATADRAAGHAADHRAARAGSTHTKGGGWGGIHLFIGGLLMAAGFTRRDVRCPLPGSSRPFGRRPSMAARRLVPVVTGRSSMSWFAMTEHGAPPRADPGSPSRLAVHRRVARPCG